MTGLLAILGTGAACVPMDPGRPDWWDEQVQTDARLTLVLDDDGVRATAAAELPVAPETALVCYPEDAAAGIVISTPTLAARSHATTTEQIDTPLWTECAVRTGLSLLTRGNEVFFATVSTGDSVVQLAPFSFDGHTGRPLPGARLTVLDLYGRPVPPGVPGELHVDGPLVADGYLRRDDLTGPAFTAVPDDPGRWAPTGTLARIADDGRVENLGTLRPMTEDTGAEDVPHVAPRTPIERVVAAAFTDLLDVSPIGVYDDFFRLGGHSLAATQVLLRLQSIFLVEVPIRTFFETPTVDGLGRAVTALDPRPGQAARIAEIWTRIKDQSRNAPSEA
jgi:non-ribosomal peptide synthetase component F